VLPTLSEEKNGYAMEKRIVLPGDQLSTSEELLPGDGTFEEEGIIRASRMGEYIVDQNSRRATVKPLTSVPVLLKKGDIVFAEVNSVRSSMVIAEVKHVVGKQRPISGDVNGTLHISEISSGYVKDPSDVISLGDVFKARVIQVTPSVQLTTKGKDLGVIKAFCQRCRTPLDQKDGGLECPQCNHKEKRKLAQSYRSYDITKK
jgi:exosome complex component CSL4